MKMTATGLFSPICSRSAGTLARSTDAGLMQICLTLLWADLILLDRNVKDSMQQPSGQKVATNTEQQLN